jgi:hypothetical protein
MAELILANTNPIFYQLQFKPARRRMLPLPENMLFCEKWTRSFELESVLLFRKTVKFFTMFCDQRERVETNRVHRPHFLYQGL